MDFGLVFCVVVVIATTLHAISLNSACRVHQQLM
jgi:hypothetical protein